MSSSIPSESLRKRAVKLVQGDYACTRVWEAWQYGTMDQDDFVPLEETERVDEIVSLIESELTKQRDQLLDELEAKESRYCGICYKPSIEKGGWWCPEHDYKSIYISRSEAKTLRSTEHQIGEIDE